MLVSDNYRWGLFWLLVSGIFGYLFLYLIGSCATFYVDDKSPAVCVTCVFVYPLKGILAFCSLLVIFLILVFVFFAFVTSVLLILGFPIILLFIVTEILSEVHEVDDVNDSNNTA
jgi:hypothetical protein